MANCAATTAKGKPCRATAKKGEKLCAAHLGTAHRPTKLTEDIQHRVTQLLRNGNYAETAARAAGISPTSYYAWNERGEADLEAGTPTVFSEFADACARAKAEGEAVLLNQIRQAGMGTLRPQTDPDGNVTGYSGKGGDWRALAWVLERTRPERYRERVQSDHSGHIRTEVVELPDDEQALGEVASILGNIGVLPGGDGT